MIPERPKTIYRIQKRVGSKARILFPYEIEKTGFKDIGLYARFPWHQTYLEPFIGGWSVVLNHPCFEQETWNTRTIPVIAVNDVNQGIIDLAWVLLYYPFLFKMTVKSAIHCQGLWEECREGGAPLTPEQRIERFNNALRYYYELEAGYASKGGSTGHSYRIQSNPTPPAVSGDRIKDIPFEEVENAIRQSYLSEMSYGALPGKGFWIRQNMNRLPYQTLKNVPEEEIERGMQNWYYKQHAFSGKDTFPFEINEPHGAYNRPGFSKDLELHPELQTALSNYYMNDLSFGSMQRGNIKTRINKTKKWFPIPKKKDYYDEVHARLRWMQIFNERKDKKIKGGIYNEDFAKFLARFIGKTDCGFIYLDPTYFKTIDGRHYEDNMTLEQHKELLKLLIKADKEGIKWLLSYDTDQRAYDWYSSFDMEVIQVPYSVARSYGDGRAQFDEELLIRNYNYKEDNYYKSVDFKKITKLDTFLPTPGQTKPTKIKIKKKKVRKKPKTKKGLWGYMN